MIRANFSVGRADYAVTYCYYDDYTYLTRRFPGFPSPLPAGITPVIQSIALVLRRQNRAVPKMARILQRHSRFARKMSPFLPRHSRMKEYLTQNYGIDGRSLYGYIEKFSARLEVLEFGSEAARHTGQLRAELVRIGKPIGPYDQMLAGHARSLGLIIVTNNLREFECVPGLRVMDWMDQES